MFPAPCSHPTHPQVSRGLFLRGSSSPVIALDISPLTPTLKGRACGLSPTQPPSFTPPPLRLMLPGVLSPPTPNPEGMLPRGEKTLDPDWLLPAGETPGVTQSYGVEAAVPVPVPAMPRALRLPLLSSPGLLLATVRPPAPLQDVGGNICEDPEPGADDGCNPESAKAPLAPAVPSPVVSVWW